MDIFDSKEPTKKEKDGLENELNDIILDKKQNSFDIKKIALLAGSVILLLILVIAIVKITSSNTNENDEFFENSSPSTQDQNEFEDNFEQVPIIEEDIPIPDEEQEKIAPEIEKEEKEIKSQEVEQKISKEEEPLKPIAEDKQKEIKKEKTDNKKTITKDQKTTKAGYYIQVGAFYKYSPNKKFLNKIKKRGYSYIIKTVLKNNKEVKKVLIGPFNSKNEAKRALIEIKSSINKDAFITRIK